jgi:hypothetical protein
MTTMESNADHAQHLREGHELRYVDNVPTSHHGAEQSLFEELERTPAKSSHFNTDNKEAVPVYERATTSFSTTSQAIGANSQMLLGRHKGRKYVVLSAPVTITTLAGATTPKGFQWANDPNLIDTNSGFQLNPGDSVEIDSEAEIFVGPLPGNTTGYVQAVELYNTKAGPGDS